MSQPGNPFGVFDPEAGFQVRLLAGFTEGNPTVESNAWIPLYLELDNPSPQIQKGVLVIAPYAEEMEETLGGDHSVYEVPFAFAPGQRKLIRLTGKLPYWTQDLRVVLKGRGNPVVASLGVRMVNTGMRRVVVLGEGDGAYGRLESREEGTPQNPIDLITVDRLSRSDLLPEYPQAYDTVTAVVWDGLELDAPTPHQVEALRDYVEMGGTLILALGDRGSRLDSPGWSDFLGLGVRESEPATLPRPDRLWRETTDRSAPLWETVRWTTKTGVAGSTEEAGFSVLLASGPLPGEPCLSLDGVSLVSRVERGAGRILVTSLSFEDWLAWGEPGIDLWRGLVMSLPAGPPHFREGLGEFNSYLTQSLVGELPGPFFIAGFLSLYTLLAIPGSYFLFRKRKRLETAWLAVPVLAILFSFLAYHLGALQQQQGFVQRNLNLGILPYGGSVARCSAMAGFYAPHRNVFNYQVANPEIAIPVEEDWGADDFSGGLRAREELFVPDPATERYRPAMEPLLVHHWASDTLAFDTLADLGGPIVCDVTEDEDGTVRSSLLNGSQFRLSEVRLSRGPWESSLGSFEPGESRMFPVVQKDVSTSQVPRSDFLNRVTWAFQQDSTLREKPVQDFLGENSREIAQALGRRSAMEGNSFSRTYSPPTSDGDAFYAYVLIEEAVAPIEVEEELYKKEEGTLLVLPVNYTIAGKRVLASSQDWWVHVDPTTAPFEMRQAPGGNSVGYYSQSTEESFLSTMPVQISNLSLDTVPATFEFVFRPELSDAGFEATSLKIEGGSTEVKHSWGSGIAEKSVASIGWSFKDPDSDEWVPYDPTSATSESALRFWNETDRNLGGRGVLRKSSEDFQNSWRPYLIDFPDVEGVFEKAEEISPRIATPPDFEGDLTITR